MTAIVMHFVAPRVESRFRTLLWFDAFGLALVTVAGTVKASDVGVPALVAIAMGAVTGCVGGIIRDTLGSRRWTPGSDDGGIPCDIHHAESRDQVRLVCASVPRVDKARALEDGPERFAGRIAR